MNLFSAPREVVFTCLGYALGCLSTGYYLVRFRTGQDLRSIASGSTGSTNVKRILGTSGFVLTLIGDVAKAAFAVWAAYLLQISSWGVVAVMIALVAGQSGRFNSDFMAAKAWLRDWESWLPSTTVLR